jgi:5,10-methylenetetrahydrofolate reductase
VITPLAETIRSRGFSAMVELVASGRREAQVLEIASDLAMVPEIIAGSITSYGTGKAGDDPIRGAATVRARGLTPNVHLTGVNRDRAQTQRDLHILKALELHNVFALSGELPAPGPGSIDSVELTGLIAAMRAADSVPFHISVAVSPFDCDGKDLQHEYARLEQKIANGADLVITQAGSDARQFAALKQQMDERGLTTPVLGNVNVPDTGDGDISAAIGRAGQLVAALKGLGYAGVYISGTHDAEHIRQILDHAKTVT